MTLTWPCISCCDFFSLSYSLMGPRNPIKPLFLRHHKSHITNRLEAYHGTSSGELIATLLTSAICDSKPNASQAHEMVHRNGCTLHRVKMYKCACHRNAYTVQVPPQQAHQLTATADNCRHLQTILETPTIHLVIPSPFTLAHQGRHPRRSAPQWARVSLDHGHLC